MTHTADLIFFKVSKREGADAKEFKKLARAHAGEFRECDPFDGKEHGYQELGAWIGDQGMAMMFMGLGHLLGIFDLLTPRTILPPDLAEEMAMQMAQSGMVTVKAKPVPVSKRR